MRRDEFPIVHMAIKDAVLKALEDVKAEIEKAYKHQRIVKGTEWTNGLLCTVEIIDRKIKEIKHE